MEILALISIYSALVLGFLVFLGGALIFSAKWLLDNQYDPDVELHH